MSTITYTSSSQVVYIHTIFKQKELLQKEHLRLAKDSINLQNLWL